MMSERLMVTTPTRWFIRGFMVGILVSGSLNAASYFLRSEGGGNLLGTAPDRREAIGFPCTLWESGNMYGGYFVDVAALIADASFALAVAMVSGLVMLRSRDRWNRLVDRLERSGEIARRGAWQVSMRGLLAATAIAALVAAGTRYALAGRAEVLAAIYLAGPWLLVLIAFVPLGMSWQQRVVVVVVATMLLMAAAVTIGALLKPKVEFDKVLMGIFVCWTPQTVLAAVVLTAALLAGDRRRRD